MPGNSSLQNEPEPVFDWIQLRKELDSGDEIISVESGREKLIRKVKENPLVPLGALLTTGCLSYGLYSFRRGEKRMSQMMMRARVIAQGFTLLALVGGVAMAADKTINENNK